MNDLNAKIALVVPCYNEEAILAGSIEILLQKLGEVAPLDKTGSFLLCVNDGSCDQTWDIVCEAHRLHGDRVRGLCLSRNVGMQAALMAGLAYAAEHADAAISIDADLQDDVNAIQEFVKEFRNGADIVYGVRSDRSSDSWAKRVSAESFYKLMSWLGVKTIYNHADFRLLSRRAIQALQEYREVNLYLRGIVPLLGFRQAIVLYSRKAAERPTHFSLAKMLQLAWDGITSFSVRPIRCVSALGGFLLLFGLGYIIYALASRLTGKAVSGWTSLVLLILMTSGVQLLSLGIIGEYVAKSYLESKRRPRYHVCASTDQEEH